MKELKDYLHLYLGCECLLEHKVRVTLNGFENNHPVVLNKKDWQSARVNQMDLIKPILRPLSDMTDNEIDELASVLLGKETHCFHKWRSEDGDCIIADWKKEKPFDKEFDTLTMGMLISGDFSIKHKWDYSNKKGTATTNEPLWNSHLITKYLLSKHFDLFGLIDAGLAIDKSKL